MTPSEATIRGGGTDGGAEDSTAVAGVLVARGLSVEAAGAELIAPSDFVLHAGERVLLLGASGAGKSLFVDLLLGFAGPATPGLTVRGSLTLDGRPLLGLPPEDHDGHVGAVFQLHALGLFDDLTVEQNLRFGSPDAEARREVSERLRLERTERAVSDCSGGERIRVALARTLLRGGRVRLYDEPTTGLDAGARAQVIEAVEASHDHLSLIVTHDIEAFRERADALLVIDPETRRVERRPADAASLDRLAEALRSQRVAAPAAGQARRTPWWARLPKAWDRLASRVGQAAFDAIALLALPLTWLRILDPIDGPRLRAVLRRDLAPGVLAFVGVSAGLVALTATYFLFERLPKRTWTAPLVQDDLVAGLGMLAIRVAVPLMVSILLAAKLGATAAANLGHMSLTRQVDALRLLGVPIRRHLLMPTASGQLAAAWVATAFSMVVATLASLVVFLIMHPGWSARWFLEQYVREVPATAWMWVLAKVAVSALVVAGVAYRVGVHPKRAPEAVVRGIHETLLRALLLVVLVHAAFAFLEF